MMNKEVFVAADYHPLKSVIVQTPSDEVRHVHLFAPKADLPGFTMDIIGNHAQTEHSNFRELLRSNGVDVLDMHELLDSALVNARKLNELRPFLAEKFPRLANLSDDQLIALRGKDLIGATNLAFSQNPTNEPPPVHPLQWMYYTRDFAVTLPQGIALTAYENGSRKPETALTRFTFNNAPELATYPIIFDAEKEGVLMQGGDMIVLNENTLLMGVDNLSSRDAARKLAQKTGMDVVAVAMPKGPCSPDEKYDTPFNGLFLHLDTILNVISDKEALVLPYFLQDEFTQSNPFFALLEAISLENLSELERNSINDVRRSIKDFGKVTVYKSSTGDEVAVNKKIVNYLQDEYGYNFAFAGGAPKITFPDQIKHLVENVLPEIRFQGANVVVTEPRKVIMYQDDTLETQRSLKELGIEVVVFDAHELVRWNGGPHCMTMPLKRG